MHNKERHNNNTNGDGDVNDNDIDDNDDGRDDDNDEKDKDDDKEHKCSSFTARRVAFISANLCTHSIGKAMVGILADFARRSEVTTALFPIQRESQGMRRRETKHSRDHSCGWPQIGVDSITDFLRSIFTEDRIHTLQTEEGIHIAATKLQAWNPDVIIFLDPSFHPLSHTLLTLKRLAPVQCVFWGNTITSGSLYADYFLVSEHHHLDSSVIAEHAEQLVKLPGLGVAVTRPVFSSQCSSYISPPSASHHNHHSDNITQDSDDGAKEEPQLRKGSDEDCPFLHRLRTAMHEKHLCLCLEQTHRAYRYADESNFNARCCEGRGEEEKQDEQEEEKEDEVDSRMQLTQQMRSKAHVNGNLSNPSQKYTGIYRLYVCPAALVKVQPEMDATFETILRHDPYGIIVILEGENHFWADQVETRLRRHLQREMNDGESWESHLDFLENKTDNSIYHHYQQQHQHQHDDNNNDDNNNDSNNHTKDDENKNLMANRLFFLPRLSANEYGTMLQVATILIDTFPFSGFTTR